MDTNIVELSAPNPGWLYHSGTSVYVERFCDGRLIFGSLQDTGIPWNPKDEEKGVSAFNLQIDGESLDFNWELKSSDLTDKSEARMVLQHQIKPVQLEISTKACGGGFFQRQIRLTNTSPETSLGLTSVAPLCGTIWRMTDDHRENMNESGRAAFSVGWLKDIKWSYEGNFQWEEVPLNSELSFGSVVGRSGFGTPFAVAHNHLYGGYFVLGLAWSANWKMSFSAEYLPGGPCKLMFAVMPVAPAPQRVIAPGETISLPDVHFGMNHESFDSAIQSWHGHLRKDVLLCQKNASQPVIYNHWSYGEHELSEAILKKEIDVAVEAGAELFIVDAGWYADADTEWQHTSGDWEVGNRLPNDLFPVFDYARSKGLKYGLWVEIESAGKFSKLAEEHPDWFISRYGHSLERALDLTKPEVAEYMENHIIRLIERYRLDLFRLDYNIDVHEGGFNLRDGKTENTLWRHTEVMYEIFDRVRERFPDLLLENCSSGGARSDLGMVARFHTTWISDWLRMPRAMRILNGWSLALPPEYLNRTFGATMQGSYRGNAETQLQGIILAHPALSGLSLAAGAQNPELLRLVQKYIAIYKDFIRPFHREARVYHHTPAIPGPDASGWCVLEYVSADRSRAVAGVFRLVNAAEDTFFLRFRGVDPGRRYSVTLEPGSRQTEMTGFSLIQGMEIRHDTALTSTLLLLQALN